MESTRSPTASSTHCSQRLDRLCDEVHDLNRRLDSAEGLTRIARELSTLNESLQALAYAALGAQAPSVRRRR